MPSGVLTCQSSLCDFGGNGPRQGPDHGTAACQRFFEHLLRQDDDLTFTSHGVEVVIDEMSLELVDNAALDYVQDLMGSYFAVTNPNATASCGCGTSFSV